MTFNRISVLRICGVSLVCLFIGLSTASGSQSTRADAGMAALQSFYNSSTGLFETPAGWWQDANALESTIDYMARTGNTLYAQDISTTFNNNNSSNFLNGYYDDEGWWAATWIKAYDFTGNVQYLNAAKTIFADMSAAWDPSTCNGGIWWDRARTYKNAIANELFLTVAARLHNRTPGDGGPGSYLDWAQKEWQWFAATGMINSSNLINDGLTSGCQNNGGTTWTYNQGVILGGLVDLYKATNNKTLLTEAETLASASTTTPALVNANGILVEPCEDSGCGNDGVEFKGPYVKNLYYLYTTDKLAQWQQFLTTNADSLWKNDRNSNDDFGLHWAGPFDTADGARQAVGLDLLNSTVPAATYYPDAIPGGASFGVIAQTAGTFKLTFHYDAVATTVTRTVLVNGVPVSNSNSFSGSFSAGAEHHYSTKDERLIRRSADSDEPGCRSGRRIVYATRGRGRSEQRQHGKYQRRIHRVGLSLLLDQRRTVRHLYGKRSSPGQRAVAISLRGGRGECQP
jgi:predicted alpha-1,6-mannanase (GH76 family)